MNFLGAPTFLPPIQSIQAKHWHSMVNQDPYLSEVFSQPPLTAYKRQKNIRDLLIRAKVPSDHKPYPAGSSKKNERYEEML